MIRELITVNGKHLVFDSDAHRFTLNDTEMLSVSKVLELSSVIDKSKFAFVKPDKRNFGTDIHLLTELYDKNELDESKVPEAYTGHLGQWKRWLAQAQVKIIEIEKIVYDEDNMTAGIIDRCISINGRNSVLDIKTGKIVRSAGVQLSAYRWMLSTMMGISMDDIGAMTLQLLADKAVPKEDWPDETNTWLSAVWIARWKLNG